MQASLFIRTGPLFLLLLILAATSCRKDDPAEEPAPGMETNSMVLGPNTILIDEPTAQTITIVDSTMIVFTGNTEQLQELAVGKIVLCGIAEGAPHGFLRRISTLDHVGDTYTLTTENVTFSEAFESLHFDHTRSFTLDDTVRDGLSFSATFPEFILYDSDGDGNCGGPAAATRHGRA
ncbi:MAG: hypothetical protein IPM46_05255 [Flavobacteriales bacterium]|nr:hypothetical protein [Flavobacteriales bacterium]